VEVKLAGRRGDWRRAAHGEGRFSNEAHILAGRGRHGGDHLNRAGSHHCGPAASAVLHHAGVARSPGDWPQFQHDAAHTGYNPLETTLGPANAVSLHILWRQSMPHTGQAPGTVSVAGGRALFGNFDPPSLRAFNAATGWLKWTAAT
jgi:hypothetical protein